MLERKLADDYRGADGVSVDLSLQEKSAIYENVIQIDRGFESRLIRAEILRRMVGPLAQISFWSKVAFGLISFTSLMPNEQRPLVRVLLTIGFVVELVIVPMWMAVSMKKRRRAPVGATVETAFGPDALFLRNSIKVVTFPYTDIKKISVIAGFVFCTQINRKAPLILPIALLPRNRFPTILK